ncbi:hypothetical protein [Vibrio phage VCPH]|nr:hypothetical protein [Vibrio phage VCPH]
MKTLDKARLVRKATSDVTGINVGGSVAIVPSLPCTARTVVEHGYVCVEILSDASIDTLAHEFAHVAHYRLYGNLGGHGRVWENLYYDILEKANAYLQC